MNNDDMATFKLYGLAVVLLIVAVLMWVGRDYLPLIAFWSGVLVMIILAILLAYFGHKLYCKFRQNHLEMMAKALVVQSQNEEIKSQQQARRLADARWQAEYNALLFGQSMQASRVYADQRGNMPILVRPLEDGGYQYQQLPPPAYYGQQLALPSPASANTNTANDQAQVDNTIPTNIRYEDIRNQIPRGHALLGISRNGVETCEFKDLMTMLISGGSSTGKSNTVSIKLDEAEHIGRNIQIIAIDPHKTKPDSLYNKIRQYEYRFLMPVAQKDEEIIQSLTWFKNEFQRRLELSTEELEQLDDILLVCDEVYALVYHREDERIAKLIKLVSGIAGYESRGYGMYAWFLTQKVTGLKWLRDAVMTTICHKMQTMSERVLASNDDRLVARDMDNWTMPGRVVVFGLNLPVTVTQMPLKRVVDANTDAMESLRPNPQSSGIFRSQQREDFGRQPEDNQEAAGRQYTAEDLSNPLVLKKFLNETGKMRAGGMSIDSILKSYGMSPGGRNNQNLKALLDGQTEEIEAIEN
jgi:hypothetical protein